MALFDFLKNRNNNQNIQAVVQDMGEPQADLALQNQVGNAQDNSTAWQRIRNNMNNLQLFDRYENPTNEANTVTTNENGDTVLNSAVGTPVLAQRGFLNDLARGAKENYNNRFSLENWQDNENKGFGYRLGEGLGTAGRILNSPLGRGLLTAGIVKATGGDGLEALAYGAEAGALNQQLRNNDALYRNALNQAGIDTNNAKGYIGKDDYSAIALNSYRNQKLNTQQQIANAKDNTTKAKLIFNAFENNVLSEAEAIAELQKYGIDINNLNASNNTLKTKSVIDLNNTKAETLKNPPKKTSTIVHVSTGGDNKGGSGKTLGAKVKIQAPDGSIKLIPANMVNIAVQNGGKII